MRAKIKHKFGIKHCIIQAKLDVEVSVSPTTA